MLMARVAAEARGEDKEWTLLFKVAGFQKRLRMNGNLAGHGTKDELKARILKERRRVNGEEDVENLQSYLTPKSPPPDSISKTGVEFRNYKRSGLSERRFETRGPGPGPPLAPSPPPAAAPALALLSDGRERETNSAGVEDWRLGRVRDAVLARESADFRGCGRFPHSSAAGNLNKRRDFAAAAEQRLLPVLSTEVCVRALLPSAVASAGQQSVAAFAVSPYIDVEDSDSSLDDLPVLRYEVDNFVIHASDKLVSVTALPVYIDGVLTGGATPPQKVYLVGTLGPKREMFKQRVELWRLVLDPPHRPQYLLKTKKGDWVRLLNAHEDYGEVMSDVLALGHFLNFVKKVPNASPMAAERDLRKTCSMRSSKPQLDRLSLYIKVIRSFIEEDTQFARAAILRKIFPSLFPNRAFPKRSTPQTDEEFELDDRRDSAGVKRKAGRLPLKSENIERKEKRYKVMAKKYVQKAKSLKTSTPDLASEYDSDSEFRKRKALRGIKRKAINEERFQSHGYDGSSHDYQPESDVRRRDAPRKLFTPAEVNVEDPPICIICDDGGDLIYCDGPCHRHFHPTKASGAASFCKTLGMTEAEVETIDKYYCPNCKHNQQQCFICGELGSSTATSDCPPEVRRCDVFFCKRFFHPVCAAEVLCASRFDWRDFADAIKDGDEKLYCPRHCCSVCGEAEMEEPGMLVQCRRCPKAWHRECLTEYVQPQMSLQRPSVHIWHQHDRDFIYCRDHKIVEKIQTPARNHLRFPAVAYKAK